MYSKTLSKYSSRLLFLHQTLIRMDHRMLLLIISFLFSFNFATTAGAQTPAGVSHSVLASGKWIKLAINSSGIYRIAYNDLKDMGIADKPDLPLYPSGQGNSAERCAG